MPSTGNWNAALPGEVEQQLYSVVGERGISGRPAPLVSAGEAAPYVRLRQTKADRAEWPGSLLPFRRQVDLAVAACIDWRSTWSIGVIKSTKFNPFQEWMEMSPLPSRGAISKQEMLPEFTYPQARDESGCPLLLQHGRRRNSTPAVKMIA
jgi:hypothetical protein